MPKQRIITENKTFFKQYENLVRGDVVVGRLRIRPGEEHMLLDLSARGIVLIPSATSQICSRSKVFQARLLARFMIPGTEPVYDMHDMMHVVTLYGKMGVDAVVCKLDRANAGTGILRFSSIEDVYSQAALGVFEFPFVVQPYKAGCRDIRVVMLGELVEAYQRSNPHNFRHNLHCGGSGSPWQLSKKQLELCCLVMERADFSYGHVDLLISEKGECRLMEINLRGGLRGAQINQQDYKRQVEKIHSQQLASAREEKISIRNGN